MPVAPHASPVVGGGQRRACCRRECADRGHDDEAADRWHCVGVLHQQEAGHLVLVNAMGGSTYRIEVALGSLQDSIAQLIGPDQEMVMVENDDDPR